MSGLVSDVWLARWEGGEHLERLVFRWLPACWGLRERLYPRLFIPSQDTDDLKQEMYKALIEAVDRFDEDRGSWVTCLRAHVEIRLRAWVRKWARERQVVLVDPLDPSEGGKDRPVLTDKPKVRSGGGTFTCVTCQRPFDEVDHVCHGMCKTCCRQRERVKARTGHPGVCPHCVQVLRFPRNNGDNGPSKEAICMSCGYKSSDLLVTT